MNPPIKNKLQNEANRRGLTVKLLLIKTVSAEGSIFNAALALNVHPNAVQYQMKRNGLIAVRSQGRTELTEVAS